MLTLISQWISCGSLHGKLICTDVQTRALPHSLSSCVLWSDLTFYIMQISETLLAPDLEFDPLCKMMESREKVVGGRFWEAGKCGATVRLV